MLVKLQHSFTIQSSCSAAKTDAVKIHGFKNDTASKTDDYQL